MHWNSVLQRQPFREGLRFIKDGESSAARRDLFDNFLYCIRSPLHVSRLHKYFQLPTCNTQARRMQRLDCNRDAVRLNYCQLERIHARARVDMSMLATGKMAFRVESGLIVRPWFKEFGLKGRRSKRTELWNHLTMFYQLPRS